MADRNMSSGFSLDDILSETEKDTEKVPGKLWSLAEIDALLADEGLSESEKVQTEKAHEPKEQTEHAEKKPRAEKSMPRKLKKIRKLLKKTMTRKRRPE